MFITIPMTIIIIQVSGYIFDTRRVITTTHPIRFGLKPGSYHRGTDLISMIASLFASMMTNPTKNITNIGKDIGRVPIIVLIPTGMRKNVTITRDSTRNTGEENDYS